uniref:Uncharacterized protein n=1 Tax=Rhizophora mucronata TaxID=61149 RepID=A0A2P2NGI4_RHIMU
MKSCPEKQEHVENSTKARDRGTMSHQTIKKSNDSGHNPFNKYHRPKLAKLNATVLIKNKER